MHFLLVLALLSLAFGLAFDLAFAFALGLSRILKPMGSQCACGSLIQFVLQINNCVKTNTTCFISEKRDGATRMLYMCMCGFERGGGTLGGHIMKEFSISLATPAQVPPHQRNL